MEVFKLFATLSLKDLLSNPLAKVKVGLKETDLRVASLNGKIVNLGKSMVPVVAVATAITTHFAYATKKATDFENEIAKLAIVNRNGVDALLMLEQYAIKMASTSVFSAGEIVKAQAILAKSGYSVAENINLIAQAERLAVASGAELTSTTQDISDILSVYGKSATDARHITDLISAATRTSSISFEDLSATLKKTGTMFSNTNAPMEDVVALIGALGDMGISGTDAISQLEPIFNKLIAPIGTTADTLNQLGVASADMAGNLRSPIAMLQDLDNALKNYSDKDKLSALKEIMGDKSAHTVSALFNLINKDGLSSLANMRAGLVNVSGATASLAKVQNATLGSAFRRMGNSINTINIIIGKTFLPMVTSIANKMSTLAGTMAKVADSPIGAMLIKLTAGVSIAVLSIGSLSAVIAMLSVGMPALLGGLGTLAGAVSILGLPIMAIIAVVGLLYLVWRKNIGGIADIVTDKFTKISLVIRGVIAVFRTLKNGVGEVRGELAEDLVSHGLVGAVTSISKILYRIYKFGKGFVSGIKLGLGEIVKSLTPVGKLAITLLKPIGILFSSLGKVITRFTGASKSLNSDKWSSFGKILAMSIILPFQAVAKVLGVVAYSFNWVISIYAKLIKATIAVGKTITQVLISSIKILINIFEFLSGIVVGAVSWSFEMWTAVIKRVVSVLSELWIVKQIVNGVTTCVEYLTSIFNVLKDTITTVIKNIDSDVSSVINMFQTIFDKVKSVMDGITGIFDSVDLFASGKKLISTFSDGIFSMINKPAELVKDGLAKVRDLLPFSDAKEGPLSTLTLSGTRLMTTLADGVTAGASTLYEATNKAFTGMDIPNFETTITRNLATNISTDIISPRQIDSIIGIFDEVDLFTSGKKLISTFSDGILSVINKPVELVKDGLSKVRDLLPFSDAKVGPLSTLTLSGTRLMATLADGVTAGASTLYKATNKAFTGMDIPNFETTVTRNLATNISTDITPPEQFNSFGDNSENKSNGNIKSNSKNIEIHIGNITLPSVKDSHDFISQLKNIALQGGL